MRTAAMMGPGEGVVADRSDEILRTIRETLDNPPEATSMHSGDNAYNNDIDWDKSSQVFSRDWINWRGHLGALAFDSQPRELEFALNSSRKLVVQAEMTGKGHIDLANGDNCFCAGTFHFDRDGYLDSIHLDSGHYRPSAEHGKYLIATLINNYDLGSAAGRENAEHFLANVKIHVFNKSTERFDTCTANDIFTGRYVAALERQRLERQQMREKQEALLPVVTLVDRLLKFNTDEITRLQAQSPKTGKDDHKAKIAAFKANNIKLQSIAEGLTVNILAIDEDAVKGMLKATIATIQKASEMRTHKNIDAVVSFFKCGGNVLPDSQRNFSRFIKANQNLIEKIDEPGVKRGVDLKI